MNMNQILLKNQFLSFSSKEKSLSSLQAQNISPELSTVLQNFIYYGYLPSIDAIEVLQSLSSSELEKFWKKTEKDLKIITGTSKNMEKFVVYKNFPQEVLDKTESEYWISQILMYFGVPSSVFAEKKDKRPPLSEQKNLKVLALQDENTLPFLFDSLMKSPSRWTDEQKETAYFLFDHLKEKNVHVDSASFKENAIQLVFEKLMQNQSVQTYENKVHISNATDILRLASVFSGADISLREKIVFKKFRRPERKFFLNLLNESKNLMDDVAARPEIFKRFFQFLHPGDYPYFQHVHHVYNTLYNHQYETFNASVEKNIQNKHDDVFSLLKSRPGEFFRKLHHIYKIYGSDTIPHFQEIISSLSNLQLLKIAKYIETINNRKNLMFAPKGNWTKVQVQPNTKHFEEKDKIELLNSLNQELIQRLGKVFPEGVTLDEKTKEIKLQTNDQELASYGRGTSFDIPENTKFIRTASYWSIESAGTVWFDNSWNFFDKNWNPMDTCCWDSYSACDKGAIFSGDPINTKDLKGRACQMIDLYLDKLEEQGVQYAVWNILAYSRVPFEKADVLATLQYGENPEEGKLYEPSRAQMVFPLQGDYLSKYIAYIDIPKRKLVYVDANLYGHVQSAQCNGSILQEKMPAYLEYLDSLPSVFDLFKNAPEGTIPVLYSDKNTTIESEKAFVFQKQNNQNSFQDLNLSELLSEKKSLETKKHKLK